MAITITKPSRTTFSGSCRNCACEFTYELADLHGVLTKYVNCPGCHVEIVHASQRERDRRMW